MALARGSTARSCRRRELVFMQPQFIIDVIKYVIRESRSEDVNDELRAHGRSHQRTIASEAQR